MLSSHMVALTNGIPDGLVSLGVGLWGVVLARWVFVNRENRVLPRKQPWRETLPLTLVAMLIAGVIIYDQELALTPAAFTGLGVGWAAVLLLDVLGDRVTAVFRAGFAIPLPPTARNLLDRSGNDGHVLDSDVDLPPDLAEPLGKLLDEPYEREPPK
jgi:hypothetical protein